MQPSLQFAVFLLIWHHKPFKMKKIAVFLFAFFFLLSEVWSQICIPLTDNMDVGSNSVVKILGGVYSLADSGNDGLIRISNQQNVIIDGDSVFVDGMNFGGYLIRIENSSHIQIKNFPEAEKFFYAVSIENSDNILIENNNFSINKVDSAGWINVWAGFPAALGGGVILHNCDSVHIQNNILKLQNDGVALYNSKHIEVNGNDFAWNTSYGIRMYFTDSCYIHHNIANNINRPLTNPSDCAALLMIVSNENRVSYNDFSYSGDGIFLGQYQHSGTPNNNLFVSNNCSGSPHNAIEATFADGNVFRHNICNSSHYGLWLGYSFNTLVDSNMIMDNQHSGIAIDRGYSNSITHNYIGQNPVGIELWEGSPVAGYSSQTSLEYNISGNLFYANTKAIHASGTERLHVTNNSFEKNYTGIYLEGLAGEDTITSNMFDQSFQYEIENNSVWDIYAKYNAFVFDDTTYNSAKIFDKQDNPAKGEVFWKPFAGLNIPFYETMFPLDLCEPFSEWYAYPEVCSWMGIPVPLTVEWDTVNVKEGVASVHFTTGTGWFVNTSYRPGGNIIADWNLIGSAFLGFWLKSNNTNLGGFQNFQVQIGNFSGEYFKYISTGSELNLSIGNWHHYLIPLGGSPAWVRQQIGNPDWAHVNYVEIRTDTYGVGYDLWIDGLIFLLGSGISDTSYDFADLKVYPNPANTVLYIDNQLINSGVGCFSMFDLTGNLIMEWADLAAGSVIEVSVECLASGVYGYSYSSGNEIRNGKVVIQR